MSAPEQMALPGLSTGWLGRNHLHFGALGSTNTWLRENGHRVPHGTSVTASHQTAGKGRLGRSWSAAPDTGLALSFLLRGPEPKALQALPLLVGLGVARAVERACGARAEIKWSNDVLLGGRKICGILCETWTREGESFCVAGLGVNLLQTREDLDALGLVYATSLLLETGKKIGPFPLAAQILNEMEELLAVFLEKGFGPFRTDYAARCVNVGRAVALTGRDGAVRTGTALDISDTGDLVCSMGGRVEHILAGEVSVRGLYGYT